MEGQKADCMKNQCMEGQMECCMKNQEVADTHLVGGRSCQYSGVDTADQDSYLSIQAVEVYPIRY